MKKKDFLALVGIRAPQWNRYESGRELPRQPVLERITGRTGTSVRWLLTGEELPAPAKPDYLLGEWQDIRAFTSMIQALKKIENDRPDLFYQAWQIVLATSKTLLVLAEWDDADRRIIDQQAIDHWKTLTSRPEPSAEAYK